MITETFRKIALNNHFNGCSETCSVVELSSTVTAASPEVQSNVNISDYQYAYSSDIASVCHLYFFHLRLPTTLLFALNHFARDSCDMSSTPSLLEVWQSASTSPFQPVVSKDYQFYLGSLLLSAGTSRRKVHEISTHILAAFLLTIIFTLSVLSFLLTSDLLLTCA